MNAMRFVWRLAGLWLAFASATAWGADRFAHAPQAQLSVLRVVDDDFAPLSDQDMRQMLDTATRMYRDKFGLDNVRFLDKGSLSIEAFFARYLEPQGEVYRTKDARRYRPGQVNDFASQRDSILRFLKNWDVPQLQSFFPENERAAYDTYDKLYDAITGQMRDKIAEIGRLGSRGKPLLRPEKAAYRSFINWLVALENQGEYDVVITNTFILYDDMSQPSPHSIFSKAKVGGVSHRNEKRQALGGRVIMGSTFGMDTDIPFFMEQDGAVSRARRNDVIGAYVIAHELGHALFKLPDHYDHGPECLMNNSKTLSYSAGYDLLVSHPGPCARCDTWLAARAAYWDGEYAFAHKNWRAALEAYARVPKLTPKNVDGNYAEYMAEVAYKMSLAAFSLNDRATAVRYAQTAAKLNPYNATYLSWRDSFESAAAKP